MDAFWVGVRGELLDDQRKALMAAGLPVEGQLRELSGGNSDWEILRTFVRVPGQSDDEAMARVEEALGLNGDLVAFPAGQFR